MVDHHFLATLSKPHSLRNLNNSKPNKIGVNLSSSKRNRFKFPKTS